MAGQTFRALDFLQMSPPQPVPAVCVVFGNERFLKGEVLAALRRHVLGGDQEEASADLFSGVDAELCDVLDLLATSTLFGGDKRLVIVEEADPFVSKYREALERYVARPAATGNLVLEVGTWSKATRLARQLDQTGLQIECKTPSAAALERWLSARAADRHDAQLSAASAHLLLGMVEPHLGLLDQELAKLALWARPGKKITGQLIRDHVGNWRVRSTWDLVDAAAAGNAATALEQLDRLLGAGESPIGVLAQIASTLRRFATATHLVERAGARPPALAAALAQAGVPRFALRKAERQLRQLGRQRGRQLNTWLLAADAAMKGGSSAPTRQRLILEQLIVRLSTAADPRQLPTPGLG